MGATKKAMPKDTAIISNYRSTGEGFTTQQRYDKKEVTGQMKQVFESFKERPKTMLMVAFETGILRANLCRYVAKWRKSESIAIVTHSLCKISKHRAGYLSTNLELFPLSNQLNLFDYEN